MCNFKSSDIVDDINIPVQSNVFLPRQCQDIQFHIELDQQRVLDISYQMLVPRRIITGVMIDEMISLGFWREKHAAKKYIRTGTAVLLLDYMQPTTEHDVVATVKKRRRKKKRTKHVKEVKEEQEEEEEEEECCICLDSVTDRILICGHKLCSGCLNPSLKTCPLCRAVIEMNEIFQDLEL